jgi:hypothetical protein
VRFSHALALSLSALLAACGTNAPAAEDASSETSDAETAAEVGADIGEDTVSDAVSDSLEPEADAAPDAESDAEVEPSPDVAPDADVAPDTDVLPDVEPDAEPDVIEDAVEPVCEDRGGVTLDETAVSVFYWEGEPSEIARVSIEANFDECGPLAVLSDLPWLSGEVLAGELIVSVDTDAAESGIYNANILLSEPSGSLVLATLTVELRVMVATEGAEPRVLFIGIDGMRPDGMLAADTPTYDALIEHAAWTPFGSTHLSTSTDSSAGWTALMTGVDSDKNGVTNNGSLALRDYDYATFSQRSMDAGRTVSLVAQWAPFAAPIHEGGAATFRAIGGYDTVADTMEERLLEADDDLYVVHLDEVDHAGHGTGFSPENERYIEAIELHDSHAGRFVDAILSRPTIASEDWLIVVATDHGGLGTSHGPIDIWHQRIGFIFAGPTQPVGVFEDTVFHMDVFPTVLGHLDIEILDEWDLDGVVRASSAEEVADWSAPESEANCSDGFDDDYDRLIDCNDADCADAALCVFTCPSADIADTLGAVVAEGVYESGATGFITGECASGGFGYEATLAWAAPSTATYTVDTVGTEFDTLLYVLDECGGTELACNDDAVGLQSRLTLEATAGEGFVIVVDPYRVTDSGRWVLNIEQVPEVCAETDLGSAIGEVASGSNDGASTDYLVDCGRLAGGSDVAFIWTPPAAGEWTFDTFSSELDTMIAVFDGECSTAADRLACNDDSSGLQSSVTVALDEGQVITVVVAGFEARTGNYVLNINSAPL